jgi:hypothetical protein
MDEVRMAEQLDEQELENSLAESLAELAPDKGETVTQDAFAEVVDGALEAVGGRLLFKMQVEADGQRQHVAAASVGDGDQRQFLLLTLPVDGGALKVETAAKSTSPAAGIAAAYAGLMDVLQAAA